MATQPATTVTVSTGSNLGAREGDFRSILQNINKHLDEFKMVDQRKVNNDADHTTLTVEGKKITPECMLHLMGGNPSFFGENNKKGSCEILQKSPYTTKDNIINLESFFNVYFNKDRATYAKYKELYEFIISMLKVLTGERVTNAHPDQVTYQKIFSNLRTFIEKTLEYLEAYMKNKKVIDQNLVVSGNNLILLYNSLITKQISTGMKSDELQRLHTELEKAITDNIGLYEGIIKGKKSPLPAGTASSEDQALLQGVQAGIEKLRIEQTALATNLKSLGEATKPIRENTAGSIQTLATSVEGIGLKQSAK